MPGLVGLITKMPPEQAEAKLHRMLDAVRHQEFYTCGTLIEPGLGLYVGWVARANSFASKLPLNSEDGDLSVLFAGEEYTDRETALRFKDPDQTGSYLLGLYQSDQQFYRQLNGLFHGMVINRQTKSATLFNDRYGMNRVYVHQAQEAFYFACEAKAILAVCPSQRRLDPRGWGEFVSCGCVLENRTLFADIHVLPGASAVEIRNGAVEKRELYFKPSEWENQEVCTPESYYQELKRVFSANLPRYFQGRQDIGISLTGGLDTRMIMAWRKLARNSAPCYSFGGMFRDCEDVTLARRVAGDCGQTHQVIEVGREYLSRFPYYAERAVFLSDGTTPVNRGSDLFVNEVARRIAPVRMTGNYGGEVLRQVRAFKPGVPLPGVLTGDLDPFLAQAKQTYAGILDCHPLTFAVFRQATWHHYGLLGLEQTQLSMRTPFLDNDFVSTVFRAPRSATLNNDVCLRLIHDGDAGMATIRTDRGLGGTSLASYSYLRRQLLEFTFKAEYAYDYGMPQWVSQIDHGFSWLHLENLFLGRHKFAHYRVWYRDQLANYVREMLLDSRSLSRPHVNRTMVEQIVQSHTKGTRNYTSEIHSLLTLEHIHRLFVDQV